MRAVAAFLVAAVFVALAGCSASTPATAQSTGSGAAAGSMVVNVVAAENCWGDVVAQIGGAHVVVTSIVNDPEADPHTYESNPKAAATMAAAQLVIENGLGYDDFVGKLLAGSPHSARVVLSVATTLGMSGDNANPHLWYDTARLPQVADAIAAALAGADPADAASFAANAATFDASLAPLLDTIEAIKSRYAGTKIAYTERVPGYLVEAAGLVLGTPASFARSLEEGNDPTPRDAAAFDAAITARTVRVLLYNSQVTNTQTDKIKKLATASGVPTVGFSETLPPDDANFQAWQLRQAKALLVALGG